MTAACPSAGVTQRVICSGCRVPGFGDHACHWGRMVMKAGGESTFTRCECSVYSTCYSYADAAAEVPGIPIPRWEAGRPTDNEHDLALALA